MLILSRRLNQKVLFPGINASVRVVSCKGNVVRLGIEAPPEVTILREEVAPTQNSSPPAAERFSDLARQLTDRLRLTSQSLGVVQLLLDAGQTEDAKQTLALLREDFQLLRHGLEGELEQAPAAPSPQRALLVEDDRTQRELLAGYLRLAGLHVDTVGDGYDALDYLHSQPLPEVVLMDMGLPRCDGPTAVRAIRGEPSLSGLRIFAVTSSAADEFDLGSAEVDRWFRKPLDPAILLRGLKEELAVCSA
jgi:carbon storage regulator CsrA